MRPTDLFDLASLTKTTATLLAVMKLYDQGKLKLTDKASAWLPWLRSSNKKNITIRDLLLHESGLLPYIRFYREAIDENTVTGPFTQGFVDEWHHTRIGEYTYACSDFKFKKGLISPKQTPTHTLHMAEGMWLNKAFKSTVLQSIARSEMGQKRYVYSDVGFVVLQQVVEAITKQPMNEFLNKEFYRPMGLERTLFTPLTHYDRSEVVPTITCGGKTFAVTCRMKRLLAWVVLPVMQDYSPQPERWQLYIRCCSMMESGRDIVIWMGLPFACLPHTHPFSAIADWVLINRTTGM